MRFLKRSIESRSYWAVSLSTLSASGATEQVAVVVVDAETGDVEEIRRG